MEGLGLYGKDWEKLSEHIGTKDKMQIKMKFYTLKAANK